MVRAWIRWRSSCADSSGRASNATRFHSRNGSSFRVSTTIMPIPWLSLTLRQSGGTSQPANGAMRRASSPLGITSTANPIAKAACGTASIGATADDR